MFDQYIWSCAILRVEANADTGLQIDWVIIQDQRLLNNMKQLIYHQRDLL